MQINNHFKVLGSLVFSVLFSYSTFAQSGSIKGKVIDAKTLEPLPFANVFLNNTTIGSVTNTNGDYLLKNIEQEGVYELVISFVGYESVKVKVTIDKGELNRGTLRLTPSEIQLGTVEVKGSRDKDWEKKMKRFSKIFLGEDKAAEESSITNPWVVDFPDFDDPGVFMAKASAPIEIENKALGYKIFFYLAHFAADSKGYIIQGNARFNEMPTSDEVQRLRWETNRSLSYLHSSHHLFKAIIEHRIQGAGFRLYTDRPGFEKTNVRAPYFYPELERSVMVYDTTNIVTPDKQKDVYRINLKGRVEVHYYKEKAAVRTYRDVAYPVSWVKAERNYVLVNKHGYELNPADVVISGEMSTDRVARMLPIDYKPNLIPKISEEVSLSHFQENVYVHTDKPYYYPGEAMWFKGYINYGTPLWRDSLSRTLYVELINPKDKVINSKTLRIDSGFFNNDFLLPDTLTAGAYYLRAYTNFSRNFGDSLLYVKPVPVLRITDKVNSNAEPPANAEDSNISITTSKGIYKPREKITINLAVKDDDGNPMSSNLSVSVTDATQVVPVTTAPTILEGFPLKEIQAKSDKYTLPYPIEYGISFSGQFFNSENKLEESLLNLLQLNPKNLMIVQTDAKGKFVVNGLDFYDTAKFSIQPNVVKGKAKGKTQLLPREIPSMNFKRPAYKLNIIDSETAQRLISEYEVPVDAKFLQEIVVRSAKEVEDKDIRTYGKPDYVIRGKDINPTYGNLLFTLPGKFPGLIVRESRNGNFGDTRIVVYSQRGLSMKFPQEVLVTLNDVVISGRTPADIISSLDPYTVESIAFTSRNNIRYGAQGAWGVLAVYTKTGPAANGKGSSNLQVIKVLGYSRPAQFRSPNYEDVAIDPTKADYRSTLYWNPVLKTDGRTGTAEFSFFASDLSGRYHVVVEGVTEKGMPVRKEHYIDLDRK